MAKYNSSRRFQTGQTISTPSQYGSHKSMVVDPQCYVSAKDNISTVGCGPGVVLCKDDRGFYVTLEERLDNGCADPKRYSGARLNLTKVEQ